MSFLSGVGDFFGGDLLGGLFSGHNAGDAASQYYNQIPDALKQYLKPYADRGNVIYLHNYRDNMISYYTIQAAYSII